MRVEERDGTTSVYVEEDETGGLTLVVRPGLLAGRDLAALRVVLAHVAGCLVGVPARPSVLASEAGPRFNGAAGDADSRPVPSARAGACWRSGPSRAPVEI